MRRNFLCFDKDKYVRSILHINWIAEKELCEAILYVASNRVKSPSSAKWAMLDVENTDENFIVENSIYIKPFFLMVEKQFYPGITLFPSKFLYSDECSEIIFFKKFEESGATIREYNSKKYANGLPPVKEMRPSELKLSL